MHAHGKYFPDAVGIVLHLDTAVQPEKIETLRYFTDFQYICIPKYGFENMLRHGQRQENHFGLAYG